MFWHNEQFEVTKVYATNRLTLEVQLNQFSPVSPRPVFNTVTTPEPETTQSVEPVAPLQSEEKSKGKLTDRFRSLIGSMFDE